MSEFAVQTTYRQQIDAARSRIYGDIGESPQAVAKLLAACVSIVGEIHAHFAAHDVESPLTFKRVLDELEYVRKNLDTAIVGNTRVRPFGPWNKTRQDVTPLVGEIANLKTQIGIYQRLSKSYRSKEKSAYDSAGLLDKQDSDLQAWAGRLLTVRTLLGQTHERLQSIYMGWCLGTGLSVNPPPDDHSA